MEYYVIIKVARNVSEKDTVVAVVENEEVAKHFCKLDGRKLGLSYWDLYRYKKVSIDDEKK